MANSNSYAMIETPHHQNYSVEDLRSYLDSRPNTPGNYSVSGVNSPVWPSSPAWPRESMAGSTLALNPAFAAPDSPGFPPGSPGFPPHSPGFQGEKEEKKSPGPARPPGPPGGPPPDGGLTAWLQVVGGHFLFMNTWGIINAYGIFQSYYRSDLLVGYQPSAISWIGTITSFFLCASPLMWGPIFDRGSVRILVFVGSGCVVFGLMMTSLCTDYWHLILAQGIVVGLGGGCTFLTATSILPTYFAKKRSLVMGIAASGSSMGGIIYPIVFHQLQHKIGFPWTVRVIGFIALATLAIPCAVIRPRVPKPTMKRKIIDFSLLRELPFGLINIATFFGFVGQYIPFFFIENFAEDVGNQSKTSAFWMIIVLNAGSLPGRIIPSLVADKWFPPLVVLGGCTGAASILAFCWSSVQASYAGLVIWALLYGFCAGAFVSLQGPCVASMTTDMRSIGSRFGINMFCGALGILIGSPVGGAIFPTSWPGAGSFCGGALLVSTCFIAATWWAHNREKSRGQNRLSG